MKFLQKVFKIWQSRKEETGDLIAANKSFNNNLYGSDDDLGFC